MKKHYIAIACAALAALLCSCGPSVQTGSSLGETVQTVRYNDPVGITLREGMTFDQARCTPEFVRKTLSVSPAVDFDASLSPDGATLYLYPSEPLKYNSLYTVSGSFAALAGMKGDKEKLEVKVLPPMAQIEWSPLSVSGAKAADGSQTYSLKMTVRSADPLDGGYLEKRMVYPDGIGNARWSHSEDGLQHEALFAGIISGNAEREFTLSCSFDNYGLSSEKTYFVPKSQVFCILSTEMFLEPYHYEVAFSEELAPKQIYSQFVQMPNAGRLSFVADGNVLRISPAVKADDNQELRILKSVKSASGKKLADEYVRTFVLPSGEPSIKFISKGTILPSASGQNIYFESSNYRKVRVRCKRIYENNILQFLQDNYLTDPEAYIGNVARQVVDTTFVLGKDDSRLGTPTTYGLNLSEMVNVQKGAIYKVEIGGVDPITNFKDSYYFSDYWLGNWQDYGDRARNILVTDLAVIAKSGTAGDYMFVVTDIISASAVSGAKVEVYNNVNQLLVSGQTDSDGKFLCNTGSDRAKTAIISSGTDKAYISITGSESLSLSNFDVAGVASKDGCKAFIFGDRGVWRPGDEVHLCFMAVTDKGALPAGHPVSMALYNPQGQLISNMSSNEGFDGMYAFNFSTPSNAPTGKWEAVFTLGAQTWSKSVRIETVKPNNMAIDLKFADKVVSASRMNGTLSAKWLTGLPAAGLEARGEARLANAATAFKRYPGYKFTDDSREFESQTVDLFTGVTNAEGDMSLRTAVDLAGAPGLVNAYITSRVFEKSGDFSISTSSATLSPYNRYLGIRLPLGKNDWGEEYYEKDKKQDMDIVLVDASGNDVQSGISVNVEIYEMGWNWWWTSSAGRLAQYARDNFYKPLKNFTCKLQGGKASAKLDFTGCDSGYYFVRVSDPDGGHAAASAILVSHSYESSSSQDGTSATNLPVTLDKEKYNVGDKARLTIPSAKGAKAFVSLEKGGGLLKSFWVDCQGASTDITIPLGIEMTPNIYASVTLVQPYNSTQNDAPIRLFGVKRICIEDAATHLNPVIDAADEVRPESKFSINVSEKDGRPMSFVLAVVDEGLLNLTSYKTPDPWKSFFATEALSVNTWDFYNFVIGAYGARMEQMFAIGGDGENEDLKPAESKADRFPPVSMFFGPYTVKARGKCKVDVDMPRYIGNVRVMAIATDGHNMGSTQSNIKVVKPVMVKMTLPRVIGTEDEISVPVTVFALKKNAGNIKVKISAEGPLAVNGEDATTLLMNSEGEEMVHFNVKASDQAGVARVKAVCQCGLETSTDEIEIEVREANPVTSNSYAMVVGPGKTESVDFAFAGRAGSNKVKVEASTIPSADLDHRMEYLLEYPHGCVEQTVSKAFPQLYLSGITELSNEKKQLSVSNVQKAIAALPSFALPSGGFTTWPGTSSYAGANIWASIYAAHFMIEAAKAGYSVPASLKRGALSYAKTIASSGQNVSAASRAYACYVLALDGAADNSSMSRLREDSGKLSEDEILLLASAYALQGRKDVARQLCQGISTGERKYDWYSDSYPSLERSLALRAMLSDRLGDSGAAFTLVKELADRLNDRTVYMSTQATSWALLALADYVRTSGSDASTDLSVTAGEKKFSLKGGKAVVSADVAAGKESGMSFSVTNNSKSDSYVVITSKGTADKFQLVKREQGLGLRVEYTLPDGTPVDPKSLAAGTDFVCVTYVSNKSLVNYRDIALVQLFPCGWEIRNDRVEGKDFYQDWRDDRVYSYFDLPRETTMKCTIRLTAAYAGRYYHPSFTAEAMYNGSINAVLPGFMVEVK